MDEDHNDTITELQLQNGETQRELDLLRRQIIEIAESSKIEIAESQ